MAHTFHLECMALCCQFITYLFPMQYLQQKRQKKAVTFSPNLISCYGLTARGNCHRQQLIGDLPFLNVNVTGTDCQQTNSLMLFISPD